MPTILRRIGLEFILPLLLVVVCITAIGFLQQPRLEQLRADSQTASEAQIRQEVEAESARLSLLKKMPSLGFDNLLADWTFLNFVQYFGDSTARGKSDYRLSPDYFEIILDRDPRFIQAYTFLSTSGSMYAGLPDRSTEIIQRALERLKPNDPPQSFFAWRQLAIDQLLFVGDGEAARRSFETAAEWAKQSSLPGSETAAQVSAQTAAFLARNPNSKSAQIASWAMVLTNAPDDRTRKTAIDRIQALGGQVMLAPDGSFQVQAPRQD
ncbi:hypothetical protein [Leptolyngbya ohadii]|uniref:hypothetical protein n=1 Tax=Leptolyngbya ohadii TaxID=1962290 RepID=UPI000B59DEBB|nr:hypothetical protein [Leptolyngbya ohadii]